MRSTYGLKVIRHVFGFGIEFLEAKDIDILGHFMVIDFITHMYIFVYWSNPHIHAFYFYTTPYTLNDNVNPESI